MNITYESLEKQLMSAGEILTDGDSPSSRQKGFEPYLVLTQEEIDELIQGIAPAQNNNPTTQRGKPAKHSLDIRLNDTIIGWEEFESESAKGITIFDSYTPNIRLEEAVTRLSVMQNEINEFREELRALSIDMDKRYMRLTELEESDRGLVRGLTEINKEAVRLDRAYTKAVMNSKYEKNAAHKQSRAEQQIKAEEQIRLAEEFLELKTVKGETIKALTEDSAEYKGTVAELREKRDKTAETYSRIIEAFKENLGNTNEDSKAIAADLIGELESIRDKYRESASNISVTEGAAGYTLESVTKIGLSYTRTAKAEQETNVYTALAKKRERVTSEILELSEQFEATVEELLHEMDGKAFINTAQQYTARPLSEGLGLPAARDTNKRETNKRELPRYNCYARDAFC